MSTQAEILNVLESETKFKLKPHLAPADETIRLCRETKSPLRVTLSELLTPTTVATLKEMGLL